MKGRDYLWCLTNLLLDREEALEERCAACGAPAGEWGEGAASTAFDPARFEALKGGRADA